MNTHPHGLWVRLILLKYFVMNRLFRLVCLSLFVCSAMQLYAVTEKVERKKTGFDWEPVMKAIIQEVSLSSYCFTISLNSNN